MYIKLKCLVITCLCVTLGTADEEAIECDGLAKEKMDQLAMELSTFGDPNGKYPDNLQEFNTQCKKDRQRIQWIRRYIERCLNGLAYDVTSMAINDMESVTKKYCDSPKLAKLYISWSTCGNHALNSTVNCWNRYILAQEQVNVVKDNIVNKDKAALICCIYHRFDHCFEDSLHQMDGRLCSPAAVDGLHSMLTEISGRMVENFCGIYQADNDKCDSIHVKYNYLNDIQIDKPLRQSPIYSFIEIIESTPDFVDYFKNNSTDTTTPTDQITDQITTESVF